MIISYIISQFSIDDIQLSADIIMAKNNNIYKVKINYNCYSRQLPQSYPEYFDNSGYMWKISDNDFYPEKFIKEITTSARNMQIRQFAKEIELIKNTIKITM